MVLTMECPRMRIGSSGCSFFMRSMCCKLSLMKTWKSETTIRSPSLCPWPTVGEKESMQLSHLQQWLQSRKALAETFLLDCYCPNLTFSCSHLATERALQKYKASCTELFKKCQTVHDLIFLKKSSTPLSFYLLFKTTSNYLISCSLQHQGEESRGAVLLCCRDGGSLHPGKWGFAPGIIAAGVRWLTVQP